jgi:hypothetical protein
MDDDRGDDAAAGVSGDGDGDGDGDGEPIWVPQQGMQMLCPLINMWHAKDQFYAKKGKKTQSFFFLPFLERP